VNRRPKTILRGLAVVVTLGVLCGIIYERLGRREDRKRLLQIGRSVDIGGRTLNIFCSGTGGPAVIFDSGGDGPGLEWEPVQAEAGKFTQACWYDRAGIGWSDPGPFPRTSRAIASDLHELLRRAGIPPPYVLVGASFGGMNVRIYNGLYPREVAGMVLVDSGHEDEPLRAPKFYLGRTAPRYLWRPLELAFWAAGEIGLIRLTQTSDGRHQGSSPMSREELIATLRRQPKSVVTNVATGIGMPESYAEARASRGLGDRPLIVLTAGEPFDFRDAELNRQAAAYQQIWIHEMQAGLAQLSTRGRQIVVEESNHGNIPPDVVIAAIRDVVTEVRGEPPNN
jgi:pimeloyl-ACP methyl ester carboxylesterase